MGKQLTHESVLKHYKKNGYTLTSEYVNSAVKDELICPNNHKAEITFHNFKSGNRCVQCSGLVKLSQDLVYNHYKKNGYTLLSEYVNARTKDQLECPRGHKISMKFHSFKGGSRCRDCYLQDQRGIKVHNFNPDRTRERRLSYIRFHPIYLPILKDDPLYESYIQSKIEAKESGKRHEKTKYTVDHIFPRKAFIDNDLDIIYDNFLVKQICNLRENLRIIPREENGSKGGKYTKEEFLNWFEEKLSEIKK